LLHDERREVNKRIHRLWREEGLQVVEMSAAMTLAMCVLMPSTSSAYP
jgi:hypothetical protein